MQAIVKKLFSLILTVLVISFLTFIIFSIIPGNAALAKLGVDASPEQIAAMEEKLQLNDPVIIRYGRWLFGALRGDFGESLQYSGVTVGELLGSRLPVTMVLAGISFLLIVLLSVPVALFCVKFRDRLPDRILTVLGQVMMAVPAFFLGILITYIFGLLLRAFRPGAYEGLSLRYLFFPALSIAIPKIAMTVRFLKSSVRGELSQDYVRTARAHGASEDQVLKNHVLRNALIPVITFLALVIGEILAGSIVAEQVFSVPGLGRLLITSISARDYPVVQAIVMYITTVVVSLDFLVDLLYRLVDPRLRRGG
ncbi:MAG: ABC transporter permease [Firmicutes bacterium]|nr:ABC transporter permease [Bacillota bacterium]